MGALQLGQDIGFMSFSPWPLRRLPTFDFV